jgi:pimeloyl-ACP methyl ester carboxylesterase
MSGKPTIVFVPGAWHGPRTWDKISSLLEAQQYKCVSVTLPSTTSNPSATFLEDITAVRDSIVAETSQGYDVVVVVHSYSGIPGASAIKGLTRNKQDVAPPAEDASGHVIGLIQIASGYMPTGLSFMDGAGRKPPPTWKVDEESGFATIVVDPREFSTMTSWWKRATIGLGSSQSRQQNLCLRVASMVMQARWMYRIGICRRQKIKRSQLRFKEWLSKWGRMLAQT